MAHLYAILIVLIISCLAPCSVNGQISTIERQSLVDLSVSIPRLLSTYGWNSTTDPCTWSGVRCNDSSVTQLGLAGRLLTGSIPDSIGNLVNLTIFIIFNNQLTGTIPDSIGSCSKLKTLNLWKNQLVGTIPESIGNCTALEYINVGLNNLSGSLPSSIGRLENLNSLFMENNELNGTIPESMRNLTSFYVFQAYGNNFSGTAPITIFSQLSNMTLFYNNFTGTIPPTIGELIHLKQLTLNNNFLNGTIPKELGNLSQLQSISLSTNQLTGTIPKELGNLTQIQTLTLSTNQLTGTIPKELGYLLQIQTLGLRNNKLFGTIPSSLGNLVNATSIQLENNQLMGCLSMQHVPSSFRVINNYLCCQDSSFSPIDMEAQQCAASSLFVNNGSKVTVDAQYYSQLIIDGGSIVLNQSLMVGCLTATNGAIEFDMSSVTSSITNGEYEILSYSCVDNQTDVSDIQFSIITSPYCTENHTLQSVARGQAEFILIANVTSSCVDPPPLSEPLPFIPMTSPESSVVNTTSALSESEMIVAVVVPISGCAAAGIGIGIYFGLKKRKDAKRDRKRHGDNKNTDVQLQNPIVSNSNYDNNANVEPQNPSVNPEPETKTEIPPRTDFPVIDENLLIDPNTVTLETGLLGSGSFGSVICGIWKSSKKTIPVAIKRSNDSASKEKFLQEAIQVTKFKNPRIVHVYGLCIKDGELLIIMERAKGNLKGLLENPDVEDYDDGTTLGTKEVKEERKIPEKQAVQLIYDIAIGLKYLHDEEYLVHRDLKPANILLFDKGKTMRAKIADFGIAKVENANLTANAGTRTYMAPEIILGKSYDKKVDIYSFGLIAYEILTGENPFNITKAFVKSEAPDFSSLNDQLWRERIEKWLVQDPAQRSTITDVLSDLHQILAEKHYKIGKDDKIE